MEQNKNKLWILVFIFSFTGLLVDGMDLQFLSLSLPNLMNDFQITKTQAGSLGTVSLIGMAIGGFIGGWASDRIGRVKTVAYTMIIFSVGTFCLGFTQNFLQFSIVRFISALGLGAEYVACNTLMSEYVPTEKRTTVLGTVQAGWSVGYLVATLLAKAILPDYGWRPLFMVALLPVAMAIYMRKRIPEPAGWQKAREASKETVVINKNEWKTILTDRKVLVPFILWSFTSTFLQFGYYGVGNWLPTYLVNELGFKFTTMTNYLVGTYTAMIIGKMVTGWLADHLGRKTMYVVGSLITALFLPFLILYHTPANIVFLLTIFGFLYGMPYAVNATYMTESFPTSVRGTAVGAAYNIGRAGSALAPIIIGMVASTKSIGYGLALLGISYALTGIVPLLFIKEKMYNPYSPSTDQDQAV